MVVVALPSTGSSEDRIADAVASQRVLTLEQFRGCLGVCALSEEWVPRVPKRKKELGRTGAPVDKRPGPNSSKGGELQHR